MPPNFSGDYREEYRRVSSGAKAAAQLSAAFKRQLAEKACGENVSVAQLALEHGLNTNMMFRWRRELRAGQLEHGGVLLPVALIPSKTMPAASIGGAGLIEIRIGDAVVRIEGSPDTGTLGAVLRSLQQ